MKKEVVIAILLGLCLGLIVTFGVWTANQAAKDRKTRQTVEVIQTSPTPAAHIQLSINSPQNNLVLTTDKVKVNGQAQPGSVIVLSSDENDVFTQADEGGFFSTTFPLVKGSNDITITSIDSNNQTQEKKLTIVYTTEL
jgi:hypothetical protein